MRFFPPNLPFRAKFQVSVFLLPVFSCVDCVLTQYNNYFYSAAGRAIETASGSSYEQFVQSRIFDQLGQRPFLVVVGSFVCTGMRNSTVDIQKAINSGNYAFPYTRVNGKITALPRNINLVIQPLAPAGAISARYFVIASLLVV